MTKNQHGYTMLLAIGCLLIVTILGLSLMRFTSNAYSKNENRSDNIQADALATKGSDFIVAELNYLLEKKATEIKKQVKDEADEAYKNKKAYDAYAKIKEYLIVGFDEILADFSCDDEMFMSDSVVNNIDKYGYCVKLDPRLKNPTALVPAITDNDPLTWYTVKVAGTDGLKQIVTLRSKGDVGAGKAESNLYIRKVIGLTLGNKTEGGEAPGDGGDGTTETITDGLNNVADIPVALEYALTTKKSGSSNNHHEDGAVFLHGGVDIYGGLNIDGNLYVGNYGMPRYSSYTFSSYPRVFAHDKTLAYDASLALRKPGTVNVGGKVVRWTKTSPTYSSSQQHANYLKSPNTYKTNYGLADVTNGNGFSNTGVTTKAYDTEAQEFDVDFAELKTRVTEAFTANKTTAKSCKVSDFKVAFVNCNNSLTISTNNTEWLLPKLKASSNLAERGGIAYLKNLTITGNNVKLQGTFFVDGNFTLDGGSVITDAVIYVTGEVNIDSSDINSLTYQLDGKPQQGTLLVFSNKTVDLNAISANSSTPSNMKAFLYSKEDLEITGSTSHVLINGGISARSIELTGMRGPTSSSWRDSCTQMSQVTNCQNIADLMTLWNFYTNSEEIQKQIAELQKQITDVEKQIADIDKQLSGGGLSSSRRRTLENQRRTLVTQKTNYENQKKELEKPDAQIATLEKQMRSRLTVYYNPDIIITYQQHGVEVKPAEVPDFTITIPSDYDRIKK